MTEDLARRIPSFLGTRLETIVATTLTGTILSTAQPAAGLRLHCRHSIVAADGVDGVARVVAALRELGYRVRDFSVDVREGVRYSSLTCTVSLTPEECAEFGENLGRVPSVVSVERC